MSNETSLVGYARVSRADQDPQLQIDALKRAGCAKIYTDHMTGSHMDRPQLTAALEYVRRGDTLVLWKMDRAGRNTRGVLELVEDMTRRGVGLRSITEEIDTGGPMGKAILTRALPEVELPSYLADRWAQAPAPAAVRSGTDHTGRPG